MERHEFKYYRALNIYDERKLIVSLDSWKCVKCGLMRLYEKRFGERDREFKDLSDPKNKWFILICMKEEPRVEVHEARLGDRIVHECVDGSRHEFEVSRNFVMKADHYVYEFESVAGGFIDVSTSPPKVMVKEL